VTPEAASGGPLARVRDGDIIRLDADVGVLDIFVPVDELAARPAAGASSPSDQGFGRELFAHMRRAAGPADQGAGVF